MKRALILASAVFLLIVGCEKTSEWKEFSPQGDGFSVQMPAEPRQMNFSFADDDQGTVQMQYYRAKTPWHRYYVFYSNVIEPEDLDEMMNVGFQMKWGDWEFEDADILYNGCPGKQMTFRNKRSTVITHTFVIDDKLYQLGVRYRNSKLVKSDVEKFFNSFTVELTPDSVQ